MENNGKSCVVSIPNVVHESPAHSERRHYVIYISPIRRLNYYYF